MNKKGCLILALFVAAWFIVALILFHWNNEQNAKGQIWNKEHLMQLQFKGKIIKVTELTRIGRYYDIGCVQLDYCNVDSFYLYVQGMAFIKIKNGKAVIPMWTGSVNWGLDYVEVNINHSGKVNFYKEGKLKESSDLGMGAGGLTEEDLKFCDER